MVPFDWFREHIGKRVLVEIEGVATQSWHVHMAGEEAVILVLPSKSKHLDQLAVLYRGMRRYVDPTAEAAPGDIVGGRWDPRAGRWEPITSAELRGGKRPKPEIPDHLPEDLL